MLRLADTKMSLVSPLHARRLVIEWLLNYHINTFVVRRLMCISTTFWRARVHLNHLLNIPLCAFLCWVSRRYLSDSLCCATGADMTNAVVDRVSFDKVRPYPYNPSPIPALQHYWPWLIWPWQCCPVYHNSSGHDSALFPSRALLWKPQTLEYIWKPQTSGVHSTSLSVICMLDSVFVCNHIDIGHPPLACCSASSAVSLATLSQFCFSNHITQSLCWGAMFCVYVSLSVAGQ